MALMNCPECGHRVSDKAQACPECGFSIVNHVAAQAKKAYLREEEARLNAKWEKYHRIEAEIPSASPARLAIFAEDADADIRSLVARCSAAPRELLVALAEDRNENVRLGVAWNKSAPSELLRELAYDKSGRVREGLAGNTSAPADVLTKLAKDDDANVRRGVAGNPSAPPAVLGALAKDSDAWVVRDAAKNPLTPPKVLARLARHNDRFSLEVAENPSTPPQVLASMVQDGKPRTFRGAALDEALLRRIAENPSTPPETLAELTKSSFPKVRAAAASNPSTHAPRTNQPSSSGGCYVATAVYGSYDCPEVWTLRRFRDYTLAENAIGRAFIRAYYTVSPSLVRQFGGSGVIRGIVRRTLDRLVARCRRMGYDGSPYEDRRW